MFKETRPISQSVIDIRGDTILLDTLTRLWYLFRMSPCLRNMSLSGRGSGRRSYMGLYLVLATVATFTLFVNTTLSTAYDHQKDAIMRHFAGATTIIVDLAQQYPATLKMTKSKYAFATLLASDAARPDDPDNLHDDYFIATRILAYQILHAPQTRSKGHPVHCPYYQGRLGSQARTPSSRRRHRSHC